MASKIETILIYRSNSGREILFNYLVDNSDSIDLEEFNPNSFWNCMGGLSINIDNYCNIIHTTNFYNLYQTVSFLMSSISSILNLKQHLMNSGINANDQLVLKTMAGETLNFKVDNSGSVTLSFVGIEDKVKTRGARYFDEIRLSADEWVLSTGVALSEYFDIALRIVQSNSITPVSALIIDLFEDWSRLKDILAKQS